MSVVSSSAPTTIRCHACGAEFHQGVERCPSCGRVVTTRSARIVLALTLLLIIAGFAFTQYFVALHRATQSSLAVRWYTRGEQAMQASLPAVAADDYRTALTYDPANQQYRLRLAQALLAANRLNEARAHLISLWEEEPADGEINLTLARLHARRGERAKAVRYYGNAINGVWNEKPRARRIATRFELVYYLMQQNQRPQAEAESVALQADGPTDPADQLRLGSLLLQLNEPARAIDAYNAVLARDPGNAQAWLGKGQASLALASYAEAEHAISNALEHDAKLEDARRQLELVRELLRLDSALRGLSLADRSRRVAEAFQVAFQRLNHCAAEQGYRFADHNPAPQPPNGNGATPAAAPAPLQSLYATGMQKQPVATERALRKDPDALEPTMQYVFAVERATAPLCPQMEVADRALLTLAQHENEAVK